MKRFIIVIFLFFYPSISFGAVIGTADFEDQTVGEHPTSPPQWDSQGLGYVRSTISTPDGTKYLEFHIPEDQSGFNCYWMPDDIKEANPYSFTNGNTYYWGWYQRFQRVSGVDIWDTVTGYVQSGDKGVEVYGADYGVRWIVSQGTWSNFAALGAGKWTIWLGNPTYHLNRDTSGCPSLESGDLIYLNQGGYSVSNPILLEYERWYSFVLMIRFETWEGGTRDINGEVKLWVNGEVVADYNNLCTSNNSSPGYSYIGINGTIRQPLEDPPEHYRHFDGLTFATSESDMAEYMSDPEAAGESTTNQMLGVTGVGISFQ